MLALAISGCISAKVKCEQRLLSDNGQCDIAGDLVMVYEQRLRAYSRYALPSADAGKKSSVGMRH
jgi:hypothetical protein